MVVEAVRKAQAIPKLVSSGVKAKKSRKKAPKNPNHKRPRGGAPKSDLHAGMRKVWNYDTGVWEEQLLAIRMILV